MAPVVWWEMAWLPHAPYQQDPIYRVFSARPGLHDGQMSWSEASAQQFGATLRRLRQERNLTQETLAFRAGITKNQVQLIESGRGSGRKDSVTPANPRLSTLTGLAAVLGIAVSELLGEAGL